MSVPGASCIRTNLDDEQTHYGDGSWLLHATTGLKNCFWGPKYPKISLECGSFLHTISMFQVSPSFALIDQHVLPWEPLW